MIKMKDDLVGFSNLLIADYFNFTTKSDPFLIQTSVLPKKNLAAGGGFRSIKARKNE